MDTVQIRLAESRDAEGLFRLICELAEHQGHRDEVHVTADVLRAQMESGACPFECLIAEAHSQIIGMALFFQTYSTWEGKAGVYLEDFYVVPQHRGDGVGRMLLQRLSELSLERGYRRMDWVVIASNQSASSFYRRLGAKHMPTWHHWRFQHDDLQRMINQTA